MPPKQKREEYRTVTSNPRYEVSNFGNVRRVVTPYPAGKRGMYLAVSLWNGSGKRRARSVHILVAEAFIGPRPVGMVPDHVDGNGRNNRLDNLEYVTRSENAKRAIRLGSFVPFKPLPKCGPETIRMIRRRYNRGDSPRLLCQEFGITHPTLIRYTRGLKREQGHKLRRGLGAEMAAKWVFRKVTAGMLAKEYGVSTGYARRVIWEHRRDC